LRFALCDAQSDILHSEAKTRETKKKKEKNEAKKITEQRGIEPRGD